MWKLKDLQDRNAPRAQLNNKWVPARPLNFQRGHCSLVTRLRDAWEVFWCKAEAFKWPEGQ